MRPTLLVLALLLAANVPTPAQTNWRRIDSPNFVAIGDVSGSVLRDLVVKFEGFRETLGKLHGPRVIGSSVPTVIVVFPTDYAIGPFRPKFNGKPVDVAGLFVPGRDVNYIAMVNDNDAERLRVVFHEYTHLVARNSSQQLPTWLSEGIAEYYSTFEPIKGGREAIIGDVVASHILRLNDTVLMPIAELIKVDHQSPLYNEGSRRSVFYAESWALVHMILRATPNRAEQLAAYLDRVSRGGEPLAAWQEAFGAVNMDQELDKYIRQQSWRAVKYGFGEALGKFEGAATTMTPSDVQSFLSDLQVELDDYDAAAARLADLAKKDPSSIRAGVTAARLSMMQQKPDAIGDRLRTMTPPSDWFLAYLAGVTLADQISRVGSPSAEDIGAVERLLAVARTSGREFPNAVARAADLELRGAAVPSAETEAALDRARKLAPGRDDYTFLHAQILMRQKEFAKARSALAPLLAFGAPNAREAARSMMGRIVDYETALRPPDPLSSNVPPPPGTPPTSTGGPPSSTGTPPGGVGPRPPPGYTPVYRTTKPGEQRLEAVFERSECVVGKGITFHFKAGDQLVTATAAKFDDVDFITYRNDLTGSVTCGPMKEPMRVYMTWRPGQTEGTKIVIAIEFLPKGGSQ